MLKNWPLLLPLIALSIGIWISDQYSFLLPFSSVIALLACLALSAFLSGRRLFLLLLPLFFLVFGLYALSPWNGTATGDGSIVAHAVRTPVTVDGVIVSRPVVAWNSDGMSTSFIIRVERLRVDKRYLPVSGKMMVQVAKGEVDCHRGDLVRISARIAIPRRLGLPGEFDYGRYLKYQGVSATGRLASEDDLLILRGGAEETILRRIDLVAEELGRFIRSSLPDLNQSSILSALLIGDQKRIPRELSNAYTRSGVNHILSISGFHMGVIAFFIVQAALLLLTRCEWLALRFNLRRSVLLLAMPVMLIYLLLTGAAPATSRSVIMMFVFVMALYLERESDPLNALLVSAMLLLSINPPTLFDISFQLSFIALWGIVIAVPAVMVWFEKVENPWQRNFLQFVVSSCAASLVTAIPVLFTFNQASFNGILSNFLIVPLLGYGAVLTGFCALLFYPLLKPVALLLLWLSGKMVLLSNELILWLAKLPVLEFYGITAFDMFSFLVVMVLITFLRRVRLKLVFCALLLLVSIGLHFRDARCADGLLHVTMLSVGQAESILIRLPDGSNMLVDGGGYLHDNGRDFGERTLAPALLKLGVRRIDRMILTHSHPDHIGGLPYIARSMPVGEFWQGLAGGDGEQYQQLLTTLSANRVPLRRIKGGDRIDLSGGVALKVLSPAAMDLSRDGIKGDDFGMNEESLVFQLCHGTICYLFTADAGVPAEEKLLARCGDIRSQVLKVGHHGSRYSTSAAFLKRVAPEVALISAGYNNRFGLPARSTLDQLRKSGIKVYRTDLDGTIELVSNGKSVAVSVPYLQK